MWNLFSRMAVFATLKGQTTLIMLLTTLMGGTALGTNAQAATISLSASDTTLEVGDTLTLSFVISGLSGNSGDSLSAFDFDILFDDSVLGFSNAGFSDPTAGNQLDLTEALSFGFTGETLDLGGGLLDVYGISGNTDGALDSEQLDEFQFLELSFTVLSTSASSTIGLDLSDPSLLLLDSFFGDLSVEYLSSSLTFSVADTSVPTPSSLLLFGTGLFLVSTLKRTRSK